MIFYSHKGMAWYSTTHTLEICPIGQPLVLASETHDIESDGDESSGEESEEADREAHSSKAKKGKTTPRVSRSRRVSKSPSKR